MCSFHCRSTQIDGFKDPTPPRYDRAAGQAACAANAGVRVRLMIDAVVVCCKQEGVLAFVYLSLSWSLQFH